MERRTIYTANVLKTQQVPRPLIIFTLEFIVAVKNLLVKRALESKTAQECEDFEKMTFFDCPTLPPCVFFIETNAQKCH